MAVECRSYGGMIRSELVARIAARNPHLYAQDVEKVVMTILGTVADALARGDRVELRDFGAFSTRAIRARPGRNPRTGMAVAVGAKTHVHFKPGKAMRERLKSADPGARGGAPAAGVVAAARAWVPGQPPSDRGARSTRIGRPAGTEDGCACGDDSD